jgi:hypothetical protein
LLSGLTYEIEKAFFNSEILRNHLTIEIKTPDGYKQEHRVLYRNKIGEKEESNNLKCIRLPARKKTVQRNLCVYDREGNSLAVVPSDMIHESLCKICRFYLDEAKRLAGSVHRNLFDELIEEIDFSEVFAYESDPERV